METTLVPDTVTTYGSESLQSRLIVISYPKIFDFLNAVIGGVGVLANVFVLFVVNTRLKKNIYNLFITSQSAIDTIVCVLMILVPYLRNDNKVPPGFGGQLFCVLWLSNGCLWACIYVSIYNMLAMTCERYVSIIFPLWHRSNATRRAALLAIAVLWCVVFPLGLLHALVSTKVVDGVCEMYEHWGGEHIKHAFTWWAVCFIYFIPLSVIISTYSHIWWVLRKKVTLKTGSAAVGDQASAGRDDVMTKARLNILKLCLYVNIAYVLCFTMNSVHVVPVWLGFAPPEMDFTSLSYHLSVVLVSLNSCMYPFVYVVKYTEYKNAVKELIKWRPTPAHNNSGSSIVTEKTRSKNSLASESQTSVTADCSRG